MGKGNAAASATPVQGTSNFKYVGLVPNTGSMQLISKTLKLAGSRVDGHDWRCAEPQLLLQQDVHRVLAPHVHVCWASLWAHRYRN